MTFDIEFNVPKDRRMPLEPLAIPNHAHISFPIMIQHLEFGLNSRYCCNSSINCENETCDPSRFVRGKISHSRPTIPPVPLGFEKTKVLPRVSSSLAHATSVYHWGEEHSRADAIDSNPTISMLSCHCSLSFDQQPRLGTD
jgi:hypothetical protein